MSPVLCPYPCPGAVPVWHGVVLQVDIAGSLVMLWVYYYYFNKAVDGYNESLRRAKLTWEIF